MNGATIDGAWYQDVVAFAQQTPWLQAIMLAYTNFGLVIFGLLLVTAWWFARRQSPRTMAAALCAPVLVVIAYLISNVVKSGFAEPRPCRSIPHVVTLLACQPLTDYSFPSNHAVIAAGSATALLITARKLGIIAVILALLMGFSRVYTGAHYPHDVLVGFVLGAIIGAGTLIAARVFTPLVMRLRTGRVAGLLGPGRPEPAAERAELAR